MKRKALSILAVLALCLTMLPMAAFAVSPFDGYHEGDTIVMDGKNYTYLGDVTKTGLTVSEWNIEEYGSDGIAKAGEGYVSYSVEDGVVFMTLNNATISAMSEEAFAGYGIQVEFYDAAIHGIGKNIIEGADTAISVSGCLTLTGDFQRIAGMNSGIYCSAVYGFGEEEVTVDGGELMIKANVAEIVGTEGYGIYSDSNLYINGCIQDVSGGTGVAASGDVTITGRMDSVKGYMGAGIQGRGHMTIDKDAVIGGIVADTYGIYVDCKTDEGGTPLADASLTIQGQVGGISASQIQEDAEWTRFGFFVQGGDVLIDKGASVDYVYGDNYGAWVEGGKVIVKGTVTGGITGGDVDIYEMEWPSSWAHAEVMDAILWGLVPEEFQCQYTQATTRAEYCALAVCLYEAVTGGPIELTEEEKVPFTDTTDLNVAKIAKVGVVNGMGDGTFAPNEKLTREQAATMLSRLAAALEKPLAAGEPAFADNTSISGWAYAAVGQVQAAGIMKGVENDLFAPQRNYTREQSVLTMDRLFNLVFWENDEE